MLEIKTKNGLAYINTNQVLGIQRREYNNSRENEKIYVIDVQYQLGNVNLEFNNINESNEITKKISDNVSGLDEQKDYVKGFKDGVEYALKLKDIK